jgi:RNA polymerase sigma-70 factor (ECF subfamily)
MHSHDDTALITLALRGEALAFEELLGRYYSMAHALAFQWTGNAQHAEDLTQEICLKLARKLGSFKAQSSFKTWFYRMSINYAKDYLKKIKREQHRTESASDTEELGTDVQTPEKDSSDILGLIHKLPAKIAQALLLVYVQELSHAEAGKIMQCAGSTVSWHVHQGKKQLKALLEANS